MSFHIRHIDDRKRTAARRVPLRALLGLALVAIRPLYALGKKFNERRKHEMRLKRMVTLGAAAIVAVCIALLTLSLLISLSGISLSSAVGVTGTPLNADGNGVTNILLLGQGDETGQDLTDTVIIASIDPVRTKSIALLSLPRDLYFLHTTGMETEKGKLNALWRDEHILRKRKGMGKEEAALTALTQLGRTIGDAFGITIHHVAMVDFVAFKEVIDVIGGIDVDVPEAINDTEYPGPAYTFEPFSLAAGRQHLDGQTALKYARSRSTTSDFDRSRRQQQIIRAALRDAKESGVLKKPRTIMELYGILAKHIVTDIKTRQMVTIAGIAKDLDQENFLSLQLNNVNGLYGDQQWKGGLLYSPPRELFDGEFVLLPVSIPEFPVTWKQVQLLAHLFFGERELSLAKPEFTILNGGAAEGSAGRLAREFTKFGFDVATVSNVPGKKEFAESHIVIKNPQENAAASFFGKAFNIAPEEFSPVWQEILADRAGDITIILGENYQFQYFQDLLPKPKPKPKP